MFVQVYCKEYLVADMIVDLAAKTVQSYRTYTDNILILPFGALESPNYLAFVDFLESRCPPRERANIKELLSDWGLLEYDPLAIVKRTHGLMYADFIWVRFDDEDITYDEIKVRPD